MLVEEETVRVMAAAFAASAPLSLLECLVNVLEAGQKAGGGKRGRQSAAVLVYKTVS